MVIRILNRQNHTKKHTHTLIKRKQTNKQIKKKKRTVRILGQIVKANLNRQDHPKKHTYTHSQKEKKGKYIYNKKMKK